MNKGIKIVIVGLFVFFVGNVVVIDGEIVFDGEILKFVCEINDFDKKIEVVFGYYNVEQFCFVGDCSLKILFIIFLVNCLMIGWEYDNGNVEVFFCLWLEMWDNGIVFNFFNLVKVGFFVGIVVIGVGICIDDVESGNIMLLNVMGNDNMVYQILVDFNGIVNVDFIVYYVLIVEVLEIILGEVDVVVNVMLDYC